MLSTQSELLSSNPSLLESYRSFRKLSSSILVHFTKYVPKDAILKCAKKLGIAKKKTILLNSEDEIAVLCNYCFFHYYIQDKNAIDRFSSANSNKLSGAEKEILHAMQNAQFSILSVKKTLKHGGVIVTDVMRDKEELLMDEGFSKSAVPGLALAGTILRHQGFIVTTGSALPLNHSAQQFKYYLEDYVDEYSHFDFLDKSHQSKLIAGLLKICFEEEVSKHIEYRDNV